MGEEGKISVSGLPEKNQNYLAQAFVVRMARVQTQIQSPQWLALKVLSLAFSEREQAGS